MKTSLISKWLVIFLLLTACTASRPTEIVSSQPTATVSTDRSQANMPNPATVYCEQQGNRAEIRTAADGSQSGHCIFLDGSECDEWAYFRGECGAAAETSAPTPIPTAIPIDPADYQQGWWTYTHAVYNFSIMLPEDWVAEEVTTFDPTMNGHALLLHPNAGTQNIRMSFRRLGEDVPLWPTGAGQGEFIQQGTLDIVAQPAQRILLVCPGGEVTSIWYHDRDEHANITRGNMEFGFIFGAGSHCEPGQSLIGKVQRLGEMIIASLKVL